MTHFEIKNSVLTLAVTAKSVSKHVIVAISDLQNFGHLQDLVCIFKV